MDIQIVRKSATRVDGTERYTQQLNRGLKQKGHTVRLVVPHTPGFVQLLNKPLRPAGINLNSFIENYPLDVRLEDVDIYHIPVQTLATLLHRKRFPRPVVVSVLDIIPYLVRNDPELRVFRNQVNEAFYNWALRGLKKADHLIAISHYTKTTLVEALGIPAENISVTHLAVDSAFRPQPIPDAFIERYQLAPETTRYVLFVGSEDPRKNLKILIKAFAEVRRKRQDVVLLKVGAPYFQNEREKLQSLIRDLSLDTSVRFLEHVPEDDLVLFYNLADVVVMPSLYEGFGYPVIEALACGTAVLAANATSLPELVPNEDWLFDPHDAHELGARILDVLDAPPSAEYCIEWSGRFSIEACASATLDVYNKVLNS